MTQFANISLKEKKNRNKIWILKAEFHDLVDDVAQMVCISAVYIYDIHCYVQLINSTHGYINKNGYCEFKTK